MWWHVTAQRAAADRLVLVAWRFPAPSALCAPWMSRSRRIGRWRIATTLRDVAVWCAALDWYLVHAPTQFGWFVVAMVMV